MRKHLIQTFDSIYILDLHGSTKKKETTPEGGKDENVFNIQQGVSINIFVKKGGKKKTLGKVFHAELYGKRLSKFEILNKNKLESISWKELPYSEPYYFFVPKDFSLEKEYTQGFKINEMFKLSSSGVESAKDNFIIKFTRKDTEKLKNFVELHDIKEIAKEYKVNNEKAQQVKNDFPNIVDNLSKILYRPFDIRFTLYSPNSQGIWWRPRYEVMRHLLQPNIGLIVKRGFDEKKSALGFCSSLMIDRRSWTRPGMQGAEQIFPLYSYSSLNNRELNLDRNIVKKIEGIVKNAIPEDIFNYVYSILYSKKYHEKYEEFIKIDFPRIPYPKSREQFDQLVKLGGKLRKLHLLEDPEITNFETTFSVAGSNIVEQIKYNGEKVFINETQYFGNVPEETWEFYIGGYQPAQKWLKDRKRRKLEYEDINHYQKIIVALNKTREIMQEIDNVVTF